MHEATRASLSLIGIAFPPPGRNILAFLVLKPLGRNCCFLASATEGGRASLMAIWALCPMRKAEVDAVR